MKTALTIFAVFIGHACYAEDFTIEGVVTDFSNKSMAVEVVLIAPGVPYIESSTATPWQTITATHSRNNGRYAVVFDNSSIENVYLAFEYAMNHYIFSAFAIRDLNSPLLFDMKIPDKRYQTERYSIRIYQEGNEISYKNRKLLLTIVQRPDEQNLGRILVLGGTDFSDKRVNSIALPAGVYSPNIIITENIANQTVIEKTINFSLPIPPLPGQRPGAERFLDITMD